MMAEIDTQVLDMDLKYTTIVTPVGVGSLAHAVIRHCKALPEPVKVVAVEPDTASFYTRVSRQGRKCQSKLLQQSWMV